LDVLSILARLEIMVVFKVLTRFHFVVVL
jgi:hypothetical protein